MPREQDEVRDLAVRTRDEAIALVVTSDEMYEKAGVMLKKIKEVRERIDAIFDPIVQAAHKAHKVALDQKKAVDKFYVEADKHLRGQVAEYNRIKTEERGRTALALERSGELTLPSETPRVEGVGFVTKWCFEVNDPDAVPREYLVVDESKIRKVVNALGDSANIPGVRVWKYQAPVVR